MNRHRSRKKNLVYAALIVVVFFLAAEWAAGLALTGQESERANFGYSILRNTDYFIPDPYLFWRLHPSVNDEEERIRINSQGFRGPEFSVEKPGGVFRIVCLGDSVTYGFKVDNDECYPALLLKFQGNPEQMEVINAGVPGYSSLQGMRQLERDVLSLAPDLLIVSFGNNDILDAPTMRDSEIPVYSERIFKLRNWLWRCNLTQWIASWRHRESPETWSRRCLPEESLENLRMIDRLARERGARVVFFHPLHLDGADLRLPNFILPSEVIRLDPAPAFAEAVAQGSTMFMPDRNHPTPYGYRVLAHTLAEQLKTKGLISP